MGIVSESTKQQIRDRVPLVDLVREYQVALVPSGRRLKGLCPFHAEKTPSFHVDPERQYYHCFGCQAGGDVFSFVKGVHHVDYPEAVELLARRAGVEVEYEGGSKGDGRKGRSVVELYDVLEHARDFYHRFLLEDPDAEPARGYLTRRGIAPALWKRFHLGFSPPGWDGLLGAATRKGFSPDALERAGLARKNEARGSFYDYFRGRVMFPIADPQGRVIGFGARTLGDDTPKYLNTPRTPVFEKSQVLYGLSLARQGIHREGRIGIVEGYTDVIMAHQAGLDFIVGSLGTAFTQENARRLSRLSPRAVLVFDGDDAGQKASERSLDLLVSESLDVRIYTVESGMDPCDAILAAGGEEFRRRLDADSVGIFEFKWRRTMEAEGVRQSGAALRAMAMDEFLALLSRVANPVARKLHIREFAERIGIREEDIALRLGQLAGRSGGEPLRAGSPARARGDAPEGESDDSPRMTELERVVFDSVLALPGKAAVLWARIPEGFFQGEASRTLAGCIKRELERGELSPARLAQEVEHPGARRVLFEALARIEDALCGDGVARD
ncbi:MAG TPA: DNA primase, partial [Planctomycetota bacterium]|nr:DNA primase [Planctomycetota bacterium]